MNWDEIVAFVQENPDKTSGIWERLSDEERKEYLAATERWKEQFEAEKGERNREDNTLLGGPPELAAAGLAKVLGGGARSLMDKLTGAKRTSGQHPLTNQVDPVMAGKRVSKESLKPSGPARRTPTERAEFPPGTSRKTSPRQFKAAQDAATEKSYNSPQVGVVRRKIASQLPRGRQ